MLMGSAMAPVMGLIGLWDQLQETGVAMERLGDVLDLEPEQKPDEIDSRIMLPNLKGDIRFDNVFFRYGGSETRFVLESIKLDIKPGQLVAIVGQSGSGKTTLAKLIAGFYPADRGHDLCRRLRHQPGREGVLPYPARLRDAEQPAVLGHRSPRTSPPARRIPDRRRVVEVAKMADAHDFITAMPLGYEQLVGERGMGLSGGQMQRLCIARALYHDPRVLILDEATSALDSQSESNILRNLQDVLQGTHVHRHRASPQHDHERRQDPGAVQRQRSSRKACTRSWSIARACITSWCRNRWPALLEIRLARCADAVGAPPSAASGSGCGVRVSPCDLKAWSQSSLMVP